MVGEGNPLHAILFIVIFLAIVGGAFFALVGGWYFYHRQKTSRRRLREQEFDEILVKRAVSAGQMAAEEATAKRTPNEVSRATVGLPHCSKNQERAEMRQDYTLQPSTGKVLMNRDEQHLKLLSVFYLIVGGIGVVVACLPFIVFAVLLGIGLVTGEFASWLRLAKETGSFVAYMMFLAFFALVGSFAGCLFLVGRYLRSHRRHTFCVVMAAIVCTFVPFGTILGVFTIIVLMRESVMAMFREREVDLTQDLTEAEY